MQKRPKQFDQSVVNAAAKKLAPKVKEWLDDDSELAYIEEDLTKALKWHDDGYEIARKLDGQYSPDAALVKILDEASYLKSEACRDAERAWVKENNIQEIPLGTRVQWGRKPEAGIGVVTKNLPEGKSTVSFADLGQKDGYGYIVEWESLTIQP